MEVLTHRRRSVHHRPGRSYAEVHEATVRVGGVERDVLLVAHRDRRGYPDDALVLVVDGVDLAVWRFPHDPYLPGLPSAIDPGRVRGLLDTLGTPAGAVRLHTRAYRPARRAVVEVTIDGPQGEGRVVYLKVLAGQRAPELAAMHRALRAVVPVPRVHGVAEGQGIVVLEALGGPTLRAALLAGGPLPEPAALLELLQRFASSGLTSRRDPRAFADVRRHVDGLARLVPDRAGQVAELAAAAVDLDGPLVPVHGDLHDAQLLLGPDGAVTGLLDVDGAGLGWMVQDLANLIAHVEVVVEIAPPRADAAADYAAALVETAATMVPAADLGRALSGAWIALATGPHRAQDPDWEERTHARLDRAAAAMGRATAC